MSKEDAASPTANIESILLTAVQEAKEERHVVTVDIPNAFIQTYLENEDDKIIMILRGEIAELLVKIAPEIYSEYVEIEKGNKVLYVECQNKIYGTLKTALQLYKTFVKNLCKFGFKVNAYDPYMAKNKWKANGNSLACR